MPAKGTKRVAEESQAPLPKRTKDVLKAQEIPQYKFQALMTAVRQAAHLPDDCRDMLVAMMPYTLLPPSDERDENQKMVVQMLDELFAQVALNLSSTVATVRSTCQSLADSRAELDAALLTQSASVQAATEVVSLKATALETCSRELTALESALASRKAEEAAATGAVQEAEHDLDAHRKAVGENLKVLRSDVLEPAQATLHHDVLVPLLQRAQVDQSLLAALPGVCMKAPTSRGPFDNMVLDQIEQTLIRRVADLEAALTQKGLDKTACAEATNGANVQVEAASAKQASASEELQQAQQVHATAVAAKTAATDAVTNFEPDLQKAQDECQRREADQTNFNETTKLFFEQLRDRLSKKLLREQAAAAAAKLAEEAAAAAKLEEEKAQEAAAAKLEEQKAQEAAAAKLEEEKAQAAKSAQAEQEAAVAAARQAEDAASVTAPVGVQTLEASDVEKPIAQAEDENPTELVAPPKIETAAAAPQITAAELAGA